MIDWKGNDWTPESETPAAHPNARFTAPAHQCPTIAPEWQNPDGVSISAIVFGGRRPTTMPLVYQAFNWSHGVYIGATMGSEVTVAAIGLKAGVRRDPFAQLPFAGYNMGEYCAHWLSMRNQIKHVPRVFHVNWFRLDKEGNFLWPGFGDNMRVLEWIIKRCHGRISGHETQIGWTPHFEDFDVSGIDNYTEEDFNKAMEINNEKWKQEVLSQGELFLSLYDHLPKELIYERELLTARLT